MPSAAPPAAEHAEFAARTADLVAGVADVTNARIAAAAEMQAEQHPTDSDEGTQPASTAAEPEDTTGSHGTQLPATTDASAHAEDAPPAAHHGSAQPSLVLAKHQLPLAAIEVAQVNHLVSSKRHNLLPLDADTALTSAGNAVILLSVQDGSMRLLPGLDGGGIGALAVHPCESLFLVAEQRKTGAPNAYIYRYQGSTQPPELLQTLPAGTERAYAAAAFSSDGKMLALVGSAPDHMLSLWQWREGSIMLRCKAFSQDIYGVQFSQYFDGVLCTHGSGHVRFWRMASTFTGLKLVGNLGKFGQVELSDICDVAELPDGKVLSGTDTGQLLLWDGGLIKAVLRRAGAAGCHEGRVEVLHHVAGSSRILSAGKDGVVRAWDIDKVGHSWVPLPRQRCPSQEKYASVCEYEYKPGE